MLRRFPIALASGALLGLALLAGSPASLQAQRGGPSRRARAQARKAYAEGQRLFRAGRFEEAEVAFLRAYEHVPNPVVWVSVAEARARHGNVPGAIEAYERYLKERPDAPDKDAISKKLEELRATPGRLRVASEPAGAAIALDGRETGEQTPAELEVPAGEHELTLRREGFDAASQRVTLAPGERKDLQVTLQAAEPEPAEPAEARDGEPDALGDGEPLVSEEDSTESEPAEPEPAAATPSTAVWVAAGLSAAALVGGTVLGFMALSEESSFQERPSIETADRGERFALFADASFGVAAVAGVTALVLHFANAPGEEEESASAVRLRWTPLASPHGAGVGARLDF